MLQSTSTNLTENADLRVATPTDIVVHGNRKVASSQEVGYAMGETKMSDEG